MKTTKRQTQLIEASNTPRSGAYQYVGKQWEFDESGRGGKNPTFDNFNDFTTDLVHGASDESAAKEYIVNLTFIDGDAYYKGGLELISLRKSKSGAKGKVKLEHTIAKNDRGLLREAQAILQQLTEDEVDPELERTLDTAFTTAAKEFATKMQTVGKTVQTKIKNKAEVDKVLNANPTFKKLAAESAQRRGTAIREDEGDNMYNSEFNLTTTGVVGLSMATPALVNLIKHMVKTLQNSVGSNTTALVALIKSGKKIWLRCKDIIMKSLGILPGFRNLDQKVQLAMTNGILTLTMLTFVHAVNSDGDSQSIQQMIKTNGVQPDVITLAQKSAESNNLTSFFTAFLPKLAGQV